MSSLFFPRLLCFCFSILAKCICLLSKKCWLYSNWHVFRITKITELCATSLQASEGDHCINPPFWRISTLMRSGPHIRNWTKCPSKLMRLFKLLTRRGDQDNMQENHSLENTKPQFPARKKIKLKCYFTQLKSIGEIQ